MLSEVDPIPVSAAERWRTWIAYVAIIAAAVALFLWIRSAGSALAAPVAAPVAAPIDRAAPPPPPSGALVHVLLTLLVVIVAARVLGVVCKRIDQPPVIGEVIAGIVLGPSLLGRISPEASAFLVPPAIVPSLQILSQVGVVLFMFLVGLELDVGVLRRRTHAVVAISHASIVAPFLMGAGLALWLYPLLSTADVPFPVFAMFMGVSMSVTAFPVLARILTDRQLHRTRLGMIALSCAAVDDVTAWCLLAAAVGAAQAELGAVLRTLGLSVVFILAMLAIARPLLRRLAQRGVVDQGTFSLVLGALLASAIASEAIGIHALFGAFLLGAIIPHESRLAHELAARLEHVAVTLLLPAFFAFTGLRVHLDALAGVEQWLVCAAIIAVACAGKFGGSAVAARLAGLGWRDASALGVLMNTRGLMELIVLNVGLDLRVISPTLFTMMVVMALATTFATSPILMLLIGRTRPAKA